MKEWRQKNKEHIAEYDQGYSDRKNEKRRERRKNDPKDRNRERKRLNVLRSSGLCCCGKEPLLEGCSKYGWACWLKNTSYRATGDKQAWEHLGRLWESQNKTCPYTGLKLTPAVDTALDHVIPKSRGGGGLLQWTHEVANTAKTNLTHEEFLEWCHVVVDRDCGGSSVFSCSVPAIKVRGGRRQRSTNSKTRRAHELRQERMKAGGCYRCTSAAIGGGCAWCERCWFRNAAGRAIGEGNLRGGQSVKQLLVGQQYQCRYSGVALVPGFRCELDHLLPKSRFPEQSKDINNLQWLSDTANASKSNLTHEEYVSLCRTVVNRNSGMDVVYPYSVPAIVRRRQEGS